MKVNRHQVPVSPAFALTDYKVEGSTYRIAMLDLCQQSTACKNESTHKKYCSVYVQLTRLQSREGVRLLQPITLRDLNNKMNPELHNEDNRLQQIAAATMRLWMDNSAADVNDSNP
jgi:hypothetical protein